MWEMVYSINMMSIQHQMVVLFSNSPKRYRGFLPLDTPAAMEFPGMEALCRGVILWNVDDPQRSRYTVLSDISIQDAKGQSAEVDAGDGVRLVVLND